MSHCITALLAKFSSLKPDAKYEYLNQDIVAVSSRLDLLPNSNYLVIRTDYFGGAGEQSAELKKVDEDGNDIHIKIYEDKYYPINEALVELGVIRENENGRMQDEFDTINLGKYRNYYDFWFNSGDNPYDEDEKMSDIDTSFVDSEIEPSYQQFCQCGNDTFHVYMEFVMDDARLVCSKCGLELI